MSRRKKKRGFSVAALLLLIVLIAAAAWLALFRPIPDPAASLDALLADIAPQADASLKGIDALIAEAEASCFTLRLTQPLTKGFKCAEGTVQATVLDTGRLTEGIAAEMQALLEKKAASAKRSSELYGEDGSVQTAVAKSFYNSVLKKRLSHAEDYCRQETLPVSVTLTPEGWALDNADAILARFAQPLPSMPGFEEARANLRPVPLHYALPLSGPGPVPDINCYVVTSDPREIAALLAGSTAQKLINGQKLDFDPTRDMLGRPIYYYLDETILALVWQQDEHGAIGTFAEVIVADASQLRRKIADDTFGTYQYFYPHEFSEQVNAVVACSGDYYNSGRPDFGLTVYNGQLMRYNLYYGQSCLINDKGDFLFTYEEQFAAPEDAQRFIDENHVNFSLNFGPVLIDHGTDVTPYDYAFGEVRDTYARCCVGQLGERHYLCMTINCEQPDHYVLVTLRQAADSMIAHGCVNAYTLDGGQTGSILIANQLINPVQFGEERTMSDIYYFATALPNE